MASLHIFGALLLTITLTSCTASGEVRYATGDSFEAEEYSTVPFPRGLVVDSEGDILVISRMSSIIALSETADGEVVQTVIVEGTGLGLTHGIALHAGNLYASNTTVVYSWPYVPGSRRLIQDNPTIVVNNIPDAGHDTRVMAFDTDSMLYVHVGSGTNIDPNSDRSRIRRFDLSEGPPAEPYDFENGEVFADGLRNEVGFDFDRFGVLWGVENGADELERPDLGGDIHNGNPAEELNRFDGPIGTNYGYPYCFSSYDLEGYEAGTQFAWPDFLDDGVHSDEWCRNTVNNRPPMLAMPAHQAPLGIQFYRGQNCGGDGGAFPCSFIGDAFVALHGSWNSDIPVGYRVVRIPFSKVPPYVPTGEIINVIYEDDLSSCAVCLRPVNAVFTPAGHLIVSSDESGQLIKVTYNATLPATTIASNA